jgi:hypothetical protein
VSLIERCIDERLADGQDAVHLSLTGKISPRETIASSPAAIEVPGNDSGTPAVTARTEEGKPIRSPHVVTLIQRIGSRRRQNPPIRDVSRLGGFLLPGSHQVIE